VLLLYFAVVICLGVFYSRRTHSTEDLILAGHSLSTPFVTGTVSWVMLVFLVLPHIDGEIWDAIHIASVPAFLCSLLAMVAVSMGTQRSCPPKPIRDVDGNDISNTPLFSWGRRRRAEP
jgi:Na+/proline symporter